MARIESDREDLFREATALRRRAAIRLGAEEVVLGTRANGWFSVYREQYFMVGFNQSDEVRRAFAEGDLYRAGVARKLTRLTRIRTDSEVVLQSVELSDAESAGLLDRWRESLSTIYGMFFDGRFALVGTAPEEPGVLEEQMDRLKRVVDAPLRLSAGM